MRFRPIIEASGLIATVLVRIAVTLLLLKLLSVWFGPERFGIFSQIFAVSAIFFMVAGGGIGAGLIRNLSQSGDRERWLHAALAISLSCCTALLIISTIIYVVGPPVVEDEQLRAVILAIGLAQVIVGIGSVYLAYLSGTGRGFAFSMASIVGAVGAAALVAGCAYEFGYTGAAYAIPFLAAGPASLSILIVAKAGRRLKTNIKDVKDLLRFSSAAIVLALVVPLALVVMRADLGSQVGWSEVGQWQTVSRISDAYMQVFGVLLINAFLPRLSALPDGQRISTLWKGGVLLLLLFAAGGLLFFFFREQIIVLAFSDAFRPATRYVAPQLMADFAKVASWIFIYFFLASGRVGIQIATEILQALVMLAAFYAWKNGLEALSAPVSQLIGCSVSLLFVGAAFGMELRKRRSLGRDAAH